MIGVGTEVRDEVGLEGGDLGVRGGEPGAPLLGEVDLQDVVVAAVRSAFHQSAVGEPGDQVAAGAVAEAPLVEKPWGQTLGYLRDNNGFLVELSSPAAW